MKNQVGRKDKRLRTNNELEYLSNDCNFFCQSEGIARHKLVREVSQPNDLAEMINIKILKRVTCMLSTLELPKSFWAKVVVTKVHLINKSPLSTIKF